MTAWLAALWLALSPAARAETPAEIIEAARDAQRVDSSIQSLRMVLIAKGGAERVRELEMRIRRDGDVISTYARFSHPSDVAGTQLVIVDHPDRADDQLLYLPALKRVNRIAGKARSGSFMGSDFFFEDFEITSAAEATHTLVSEDAASWVIDSVPGADSSYGRIRSHVSKADHLPRKVEFFDRAGVALKVLEVQETAVDSGVTLPIRSVMTNLQKGTSTRMEVTAHRLNVPAAELPDETFTAAFLERNG